MSIDITLEILPSGAVRFKRGDKQHNEQLAIVLAQVIDDPEVMAELACFFKGSEDIELLMGDTILCG
jgi:hypothetical protein